MMLLLFRRSNLHILKTILFSALICNSLIINSQNIETKAGIFLTTPDYFQLSNEILDTLSNPADALKFSDSLDITGFFRLTDTSNIGSFVIEVGDSANTWNIFSDTIPYDPNVGISPYPYKRKQKFVRIELGRYLTKTDYYCRFHLYDTLGTTIDTIFYETH